MTNNIIEEWIEFFWKFGITIWTVGSILLFVLAPIILFVIVKKIKKKH